jgi:hypothetical protein
MMKLQVRAALAWMIVVATLVAPTEAFSAAKASQFQGAWEGTLSLGSESQGQQEWKWTKNLDVRLVVSKSKASVYLKGKGEWVEIKPGTFTLSAIDTNAVVVSITSGRDDDGRWVETWSFAITVIDDKTLQVLWQRQVKNKDMDPSKPDAVFGKLGFGELTKVSGTGV